MGKKIVAKLTKKQQQICDLVCKGLSDKEIGRLLSIHHRTVQDHCSAIYRRMEVRNKVNLVIKVLNKALDFKN